MPAVFRLPRGEEFEIENDLALAALARELVGATEFQHGGEITRALEEGETAVIDVDTYSLRMVTRAFENARAGELLDDDGKRVYDALVTYPAPAATYTLVTEDGTDLGGWHPPSGFYGQGERLVTDRDHAWLVVESPSLARRRHGQARPAPVSGQLLVVLLPG